MKKILAILALFAAPAFAQVGQSPASIIYSGSDPNLFVNCSSGTTWWNYNTNEQWICEVVPNQAPRYVNLSEAAGATAPTPPDGSATAQAGFAAPPAPAIQHATVGAEIGTNGSFVTNLNGWTGTNWAWAAGDKALHTAGSTAALTQNVTVVTGNWYQVQWTMSGGTAGSLAISLGAQSLRTGVLVTVGGEMIVFQATVNGSQALSATPTTDFNGNLDAFTIKPYTAEKPIIFTFKDFSGTAFAPVRGAKDFPGATTNLYIGADSGRFGTGDGEQTAIGMLALRNPGGNGDGIGGYRNTAIGAYALRDNTLGIENSAFGRGSMSQNTMGSRNVALGMNTLNSARGINDSVAVGYNAFLSATYSAQPAGVGVGNSVLRSQTTGNRNTAVGNGAGFTGSAVTTSTLMTFLGQDASLGSSTQRTNASAIGANARVDCDNCMLFGDSGITQQYFGAMTAVSTLNATNYKMISTGRILWTNGAISGSVDTGIERVGANSAIRISPDGSALGAILFKQYIQTNAVTLSVNAANPNMFFTNTGDGDGSILNLPNDPAVGLSYKVALTVAQNVQINSNTGETIQDGVNNGTHIACAAIGCTLEIVAVTGGSGAVWMVVSKNGTWTVS